MLENYGEDEFEEEDLPTPAPATTAAAPAPVAVTPAPVAVAPAPVAAPVAQPPAATPVTEPKVDGRCQVWQNVHTQNIDLYIYICVCVYMFTKTNVCDILCGIKREEQAWFSLQFFSM